MNLIDTHFHLDLWEEPQKILQEIEESKIYTIAVTNAPSVYYFTEHLTNNKKYIRPAIGLHPELISEKKKELPLFKDLLQKTRYVGEIGLDRVSKSELNKKEQLPVFEKIINYCAEYNDKILTVHSRGSVPEVLEIIGNNFPNKVILHWYSDSIANLEKAVEYGYYFSVNYPMTISKKGKNIISKIPENRLLTETDSPFTQIDFQICKPIDIEKTINKLSIILNKDANYLRKLVFDNFKTLL